MFRRAIELDELKQLQLQILKTVADFCEKNGILIVGADQNHEGFKRAIDWCESNGKSIIKLERTPNICSSSIKRILLS